VRIGDGSTTALHSTGYPDVPQGGFHKVTVSFRAKCPDGVMGTAQVSLLEEGPTAGMPLMLGQGKKHAIGGSWVNLEDPFAVDVAAGAHIDTQLDLAWTSGPSTSVEYTIIWIELE
jgi:hypothetical protein